MTARLLNSADCQENYRRFTSRVAAFEAVWFLSNGHDAAYCESDEYEDTDVIVFFSDAAYARRAQSESFPEYRLERVPLFDFLYRWLPGMTRDGHLAGPNWTGDMIGLEVEAFDLREKIEEALSAGQKERFQKMYEEATRED